MRAVRVHEWGADPVVEDVAPPTPKDGETLVRVEAAAVAHLDLTVASGDFDLKPALPYIGGVEGCGTVVSSDVYEPGTRVVLRGGGLGLLRDGTWAEFVATRKAATPLPADLPPEVGATYFVPTTTAYTALYDVARIGAWPGLGNVEHEVVVVAGAAGAVGSMVAQLAVRAGCTVLGVVDPAQADPLPAGVEPVHLGDEERAAELLKERPATLLVDTLGGQAIAQRSRWVRPGGRAVVVGYVAGKELALDVPSWLLDDVALLPVNMIRRETAARDCAPLLAELLAKGELTLQVESFAMDDAPKALKLLATGGLSGRAVILPRT
ncbi:quinone oxidoreductase family protein [Kribbella speibonae]|uniref:Zinc-binding alcohol dehydrogenase family protein n=1 Tax=Kribbella speibonae TaxID=1572660 RepID=A0A4R0IAS6_9ACTN|nr:zinc-binding dehydrogenase [Kribbella speibonae]TCC28954.1 zinc-binding alcohol dehydrogenase family protein [Kribbella speibonae]